MRKAVAVLAAWLKTLVSESGQIVDLRFRVLK
jgi:hypothetical protein